jgi:hypothetical protein
LEDRREGLIPLYGFLEGDTLGLLVLAYKADTIRRLAERLQQSARTRVAHRPSVNVLYKGRVLEPDLTVEMVGIEPLERFDVVAGEG